MAILEVIKCEAPAHTMIWTHPAEDFNTNSVLIVDQTQVALLFKNGRVADVFNAGRHVLSTQNIPILRKILELPTGGVSSFSCKVVFINLVEAMNVKWGLNSKVTYIEPTYQIPISLGARGVMSVRVRDPAALILNIAGTGKELTADTLADYFRSQIVMRVKSYLTRTITEQQLDIFSLDGQLDILAEALRERILPDVEKYGFTINMFTVDEVIRPEDDPMYIRVKRALSERATGTFEARTNAEKSVIAANASAQVEYIKAQGHAQALAAQGVNYVQERQFDISEKMAENAGMNQMNGLTASMAAIPAVMAMGNQMSSAINQAVYAAPTINPLNIQPMQPGVPAQPMQQGMPVQQPAPPPQPAAPEPAGVKLCPNCGTELPLAAKFCFGCGQLQPKVCPSCGSEMPDNAKFCLECGARL